MKCTIMQPYFFPYLGYFSLIKQTDKFILFDTPQFIRHGWIERNRILKPIEGVQYIRVPLKKHSRNTPINQVIINDTEDWIAKLVAQLAHYKKRAPYFKQVVDLINELKGFEFQTISDLNIKVLKLTCDYLSMEFNYDVFSKMNLNIVTPNAADEWALNICRALKAEHYINPIGGLDFFDQQKYVKNNIQINFLDFKLLPYDQKREIFEPGLSIIDVMMFNSPEEISKMLNNYDLL